ncbi:MAG: hypothetical protein JGK24_29235 [Microcoleus sp. PH2017_29_MFU_D_A]|uniref:hypothetical protein n=1 Tax=unclassified Microcoleus TaxID=2642155 RepID=UPI001D2D46ED|nr:MULTISPECIES: hypothetical protein [unclassified Microcoleus]MCC3416474.1 hypothetical protein [Microcoleus sp. PH2017_07_MST_O_A]MCC3511142.1 hypothetical protein [Microcoleus sp. PH2017_17_BER_D_A]MCC3423835.1 hypothetical protein [Microcoleus sp. PH2017_01_SCD_O_A]MCC3452784.1 hypothetical protein [Microcoleus sp. PH2017_08_TRC_O_A]MCC3576172.1 hypothetical protein [Microcoleus sp. PH2017_34_RAT_O_A]
MDNIEKNQEIEQRLTRSSTTVYTQITVKLRGLEGTSDREILELFSGVDEKEIAEIYVWPALRLMWKLRAKEVAGCRDDRKLKECAEWMRRELREVDSLASSYLEEAPLTSISAGDYKQLVLSCFEVLKRMSGSGSSVATADISVGQRYAEESLSENQMSEEEARIMALKSLQNLSDSF